MIPEQMLDFLCLSKAFDIFVDEAEEMDEEGKYIKVRGEWYDTEAMQRKLWPYFEQIMSPFKVERNAEKSE